MWETKTAVKNLIFHLLDRGGIEHLPWGRGRQPLILFAHRVMSLAPEEPAEELFKRVPAQAIDREFFQRRLNRLRRHWHFVPLEAAVTSNPNSRAKGQAVLTFDDTYADFLRVIQPMLENLNLPAVYYITLAALDQQELLCGDQVFSSIAGARLPEVKLEVLGNLTVPLGCLEDQIAAVIKINSRLNWAHSIQRAEAVQELAEKLGKGPLDPRELYLSRQDLATLAAAPGMTIGSHSLTHPNFVLLSEPELERELAESRHILRELTGQEVNHLSYPGGLWNDTVAAMARWYGYRTACATARGMKGHPYALSRVNLGWWSEAEFAVRTSRPFW